MAWTTPRNWVAGELATAALMNSAVRDDLSILKTSINDDGSLKATGGGSLVLLHAASGTDATAGAADMDTYALASQLTAMDALVVVATVTSSTGTGGVMRLRNTTDTLTMWTGGGNAQVNPTKNFAIITCAQNNTKLVNTFIYDSQTGAPNWTDNIVTFTTDPTGNWSLALGHTTNNGTLRYRWLVYKLAGQ